MIKYAKTSKENQTSIRTITYRDFTWVDIVRPTQEATKYLAEHYDFNMLDLEDALSLRQVPKIEEYEKYLFIVSQISVYDKMMRLSTRKQWSTFLGTNYLVMLRPPEFKVADELFRDCEISEDAREQYLSHGTGYLLYQILDRAIDRYFKVLDKIYSKIEDIEDGVFKEEVEAASQLSSLRRDIINQRQVMFPMRTLLGELETKLKQYSKTDLTLYFSDLMDHVNKVCTILDEYTEVIEVFKDLDYLQSSYRANRTIRGLTVLLAICLPLLTIIGIYLILPEDLRRGSITSFALLSVIIVVLISMTLYFLRRRHLI
jgi:magnesium transporter